ncbi:MAG: hypothetical protein V1802_03000 [Candidatus Aenigmatarchaeota archaeon]
MPEKDNDDELILRNESKISMIKGTMKTFFDDVKGDFRDMDHKLMRILFGVIGFAIAAAFWYFFLRNMMPFGG